MSLISRAGPSPAHNPVLGRWPGQMDSRVGNRSVAGRDQRYWRK